MRIGAVVQARMSSRRLPGKVLRKLHGRPMLQYLLERLERCRTLDEVVVATTTDPSDDQLAEYCGRVGVLCHRGPRDNVAERLRQAGQRLALDAFVRVCGDSPLLDGRLVDRAVDLFRSDQFDVVTNVMPRSFPTGQSVEVVRSTTLADAVGHMSDQVDLEHVTRFFYRNSGRYRIQNFSSELDHDDVSLAVDTSYDFDHIAALIAAMTEPQWQYGVNDLLRLRRDCLVQT